MAEGNNFKATVEALFQGMDSVVTSKTVVGEAIHINGTIILPLVDVSFGIGAGSFNAEKKEKGMGGMGGKISPSAVIVIQDGRTKLVNIKNQDTITKILDMIPDVVDRFTTDKEDRMTEKEVKDIIFQLAERRLQSMISYAEAGADMNSRELMERIRHYFLESSQKDAALTERADQIQNEFVRKLQTIDVLYTNETKVSKMIRNGTYQCGDNNTVLAGDHRGQKLIVDFSVDKRLDYFDLMVADAVYTLFVWGKEKIYPKNILILLSGDTEASMKPASHTKDAADKRKCIEESLEKMMDTKIRIDRSRGKIGFCFPDEEASLILEGRFLPLKKEGKSSYRILETPPLYRYAELTNGQFFTIPREILCVWSHGKKMPNSVENLKLRHFMARRLLLSKPYRARFSGKQMSRIVRFIHEKNYRRGMFEILSLELDGSKYLKKRKRHLLTEKVREILDYYQAKNQIAGYKMIIGETDLGRNEIIGIELQYYYN